MHDRVEKAQDGLASIEQISAESPAYCYHEGLLVSERSGCLLRLERPQEAAANARAVLALFDQSYVGSRASCALFLGDALLKSGEIDEAARIVGEAAGLAARTHSARLVKELRTTRARMQPWQNIEAIKALDGQLAAYGLVSSTPV
ncbi:MAG: hypothetical protein M3460_03925 [Actinomycetota bacterium]|nr:hypothetical protein [Actinomycetota bacterium]